MIKLFPIFFTLHFFCGQETRNAVYLFVFSTLVFCVRRLLGSYSKACLEHIIDVDVQIVLGVLVTLPNRNIYQRSWLCYIAYIAENY